MTSSKQDLRKTIQETFSQQYKFTDQQRSNIQDCLVCEKRINEKKQELKQHKQYLLQLVERELSTQTQTQTQSISSLVNLVKKYQLTRLNDKERGILCSMLEKIIQKLFELPITTTTSQKDKFPLIAYLYSLIRKLPWCDDTIEENLFTSFLFFLNTNNFSDAELDVLINLFQKKDMILLLLRNNRFPEMNKFIPDDVTVLYNTVIKLTSRYKARPTNKYIPMILLEELSRSLNTLTSTSANAPASLDKLKTGCNTELQKLMTEYTTKYTEDSYPGISSLMKKLLEADGLKRRFSKSISDRKAKNRGYIEILRSLKARLPYGTEFTLMINEGVTKFKKEFEDIAEIHGIPPTSDDKMDILRNHFNSKGFGWW